MSEVLLSVNDLKTYFPIKKGLFGQSGEVVKAVDGVSFQLKKGRRWGWSGKAAAANRRQAEASCA